MVIRSIAQRQIRLRLIHDGVQPGTALDEPLLFGLQDGKGVVHQGIEMAGMPHEFSLTLDVIGEDETVRPVFRGAFAHGTPQQRFIYLSWRRHGEHQHPWGWRIKIPLSGIGWADIHAAMLPGNCLAANVIGRRPHATEAIHWHIDKVRTS